MNWVWRVYKYPSFPKVQEHQSFSILLLQLPDLQDPYPLQDHR